MKTKILTLAIFTMATILTVPVNAQVSFGTRHGLAISTLAKTGDLYDNDEMLFSYTGGIFITAPVKGVFAIQPELNYICKGRSDETTEFIESSYRSRYHYLQVPVLARFNTNLSMTENTKVYFNAGPYISALLISQNKPDGSSEWKDDDYDEVGKDPDLGIILGMGVTFPVNRLTLQADLRYDLGLAKLNYQPEDYHTKALSLTIGILF
ncbi:porin family protein [Lentimicrobium sp.]|jgi:hypothetical protein|uniref:porin family protein n=3 Tax=Lentimicrobium sp. TaxID=2034841 RepID=UPI0025D2ABE9|nr:porin family protein [Lentimicrobium sp.]MCO5256987.1 PorT family protein [Lentimicrobium sp.]MCO5261284.1 PorT family protein [Lentimicrobium sp.]HPF64608.1 porin family protein [Lentimicrobium sp.]HPJ62076.1 porin family protein [Lentimicrobium sp.]HPR24822.1 porin family protein [Lentimicrobium sp.]